MILEPWALEEQRVWRHLNTFGGYRWPTPPVELLAEERAQEKPMRLSEALDEVEWLLDGGMPAWLAIEQVGRTKDSLQQAAYRRGRYELARRITAADETQWNSGIPAPRRKAS